jgi:integron integrase
MGRIIRLPQHRHPRPLGEEDGNRFLILCAAKQHVAAYTQKQALSAILVLYEHVLEQPLDRIERGVRARRPKWLHVALEFDNVSRVMAHPAGGQWLIAMLWYGGSLRLLEPLRPRVKDIDVQRGESHRYAGKGDKQRPTAMPRAVIGPLREHLRRLKPIHRPDLADGYGRAPLPHALARKYPNANPQWAWQFMLSQALRWRDPKTGEQRRHSIDESLVQGALNAAVDKAGLAKRVASHTLRHSFATHGLADVYDTAQELLGHREVRTTTISTHLVNRGGRCVAGPAHSLTSPDAACPNPTRKSVSKKAYRASRFSIRWIMLM